MNPTDRHAPSFRPSTSFRVAPIATWAVLVAGVLSTAGRAAAQEGHWQFNETSGVTAKDASGNGNDGTLMNFPAAPWVAGKFNNALSFDGVDDYVDVNIKQGLPIYDGKGSPYSVAFWVKGPPQEDRRVYSEGNGSGNNSPLFTVGTGRVSLQTGDKLHIFIRNDAGKPIVNSSSVGTVFDNTWHHVAWVDVGGMGTLYIDGVKDGRDYDYTSTNASGGRGTQTPDYGTFTLDAASIGAVLRQSSCCWFQGEIDDLRVYRFALNPADIGIIITTAAPNYPPCTASVGKFGYGCGGTLDIAAKGTGQFGTNLSLQLTGGTPSAAALLFVGAPVTPLDLSIAGFNGCIAYPSFNGAILAGIGTLDAAGASQTINVTMPNNTALACVVGAVQGVAISGARLELSGVILAQLGR